MDLVAGSSGSNPPRCACKQHDPRRRDAVSRRHSLSRRRADRLRQRRLSGRAGEGARRDRRRRGFPRAPAGGAPGGPLSRARDRLLRRGHRRRARSKARWCGSILPARSMSSSGACPQGQGMETIFAQIVADTWSVDSGRRDHGARRHRGDRDRLRHHREPQHRDIVGRHSCARASGCARRCSPSAPICWNAPPSRPRAAQTAASASSACRGPRYRSPKVAQAARPGWDHGRPQGVDAGLEETYYYEPPTVTWSYAAHAAVIEVDIELGRVTIEKYVIAHDCGVVVNPMLVEGQMVGGAAQGIGGALFEEFNYNSDGQLLTGSFMDYMMPTACEVPNAAGDPPALAVAAQSARRQGRRRRRRDCAAGCDCQRGVRCAQVL